MAPFAASPSGPDPAVRFFGLNSRLWASSNAWVSSRNSGFVRYMSSNACLTTNVPSASATQAWYSASHCDELFCWSSATVFSKAGKPGSFNSSFRAMANIFWPISELTNWPSGRVCVIVATATFLPAFHDAWSFPMDKPWFTGWLSNTNWKHWMRKRQDTKRELRQPVHCWPGVVAKKVNQCYRGAVTAQTIHDASNEAKPRAMLLHLLHCREPFTRAATRTWSKCRLVLYDGLDEKHVRAGQHVYSMHRSTSKCPKLFETCCIFWFKLPWTFANLSLKGHALTVFCTSLNLGIVW